MQQFEARLTEMEPFLINWANTTFSNLDEATRDEALQRTRITLWTRYRGNPVEFEQKPPRRFTQYAKTIYAHSLYDKKSASSIAGSSRRATSAAMACTMATSIPSTW